MRKRITAKKGWVFIETKDHKRRANVVSIDGPSTVVIGKDGELIILTDSLLTARIKFPYIERADNAADVETNKDNNG